MFRKWIIKGKIDLVWSFMLDYENNDNPFYERKSRIIEWKNIAVSDCDLNDEIKDNAEELTKIGLRKKNAAHIACALFLKADYFLTTDKRILNKTISGIRAMNPIIYIGGYNYKV